MANIITSIDPLLDTCAGLNSGQYDFHVAIYKQYPDSVVRLIEFDDPKTPFEPVCLTGAVTNPESPETEEAIKNGTLRAVIIYRLPYIFPDGRPVTLNIALGDNMAVHTILGWPFITSARGLIDTNSMTFTAHNINTTFPIIMQNPSAIAQPQPPKLPPVYTTTPNRPKIDNRPAWLANAKATPNPPPPPTPKPPTQPPMDPYESYRHFVQAFHTQSSIYNPDF